MPQVPLKKLLHDARALKYGIPNFWGGAVEKVVGHIAAAEKVDSPLIMCYNQGLCPLLPLEIGVPLIVHAAKHAKVPVATILDHGTDFDTVKKSIDLGLSSVMFDGSHLPYNENVMKTREIVEFAHARGVDVEAELGAVGGSATETGGYSAAKSVFTDPDLAVDFVRSTNIDALAISFGNVHGRYKGRPKLDLDLVRTIASKVPIPLVMHGASGLAESMYGEIIKSGISKINYYTALALKFSKNLRNRFLQNPVDVVCHQVIAWNIEFIVEETTRLLNLFGCSGKAGLKSAASGGSPVPYADEETVRVIVQAVMDVFSAGNAKNPRLIP